MKLTAKVKLQTSDEQCSMLLNTLEVANQACDAISIRAWESGTFGKFQLQKIVYRDIKESFGLTAQMVIRCIAKVTDAYKLDKHTLRTFKPHGSIAYDNRILRWYIDEQMVSIWTMQGRQRIAFACGERQKELLQGQRGEADLCYIDSKFYLFATCDVDEPTSDDVTEFLGVDMGIVNIATDSDGNNYAGNHVNNLCSRHAKIRARLQAKRTKSAKRLLKLRGQKESRMRNDVNHKIAKELVQRAKDTGRGIALEDLLGIRERITVRKAQRRQYHSWSFYDLRAKIEYKAQLAGVPVVVVDPRNTSKTCPCCQHVDKRNRSSRDDFSCVSCGFSGPADHIAAINISRKANGIAGA